MIQRNGKIPCALGLEELILLKWPSYWDFPGGPVVKNPPYKAGDTGLIPGQGTKMPHAAGQLSPRTTTTELVHLY